MQIKQLMTTEQMKETEKIAAQRKMVFEGESKVVLFAPCKVGEGIIKLDENEWKRLVNDFQRERPEITCFIPASGSGSRMFKFLYDFIQGPNEGNIAEVERFMNHLRDFAFYQVLPQDMKEKVKDESIDAQELAQFLLSDQGLGFGISPKGLVPFHYSEPFVLNPFQEHVLQGSRLVNGKASFHFTVQPEFLTQIQASISNLEGMTGKKYKVNYSVQSPESNSVAFNEDGLPAIDEDGSMIMRPAGHGALLENLNQLDEEIIFIKNIDNVQHLGCSQQSSDTWAVLGALLGEFRTKLKELYDRPTREGLVELNADYQFLSPDELNAIKDPEEVRRIANRPVRVCGMVRNDGQPGGGPFWIEDNGRISKQIVEKAQITQKGEQFGLMVKSTHFNPVMIALSTRNAMDNKVDLMKYRDDSKYFMVSKQQKGQTIRYVELPGLWNGGMANWNTLFLEIPQQTFSPVKTVLDLLDSAHTCH